MNEVEAVKNMDDVERIKGLLNKHYGQLFEDVWSVGINAALRISDLLAIEYRDVKTADGKTTITIKEGKTGKTRIVKLNKSALAIIERRQADRPDDVYLFQSTHHKAKGKPITRQSIARAFKDVGYMVDVELSTHSMRKTRGYHLYKKTNDLALVQKLLNHTNSAETLRYIGVNDKAVDDSYDDLEL